MSSSCCAVPADGELQRTTKSIRFVHVETEYRNIELSHLDKSKKCQILSHHMFAKKFFGCVTSLWKLFFHNDAGMEYNLTFFFDVAVLRNSFHYKFYLRVKKSDEYAAGFCNRLRAIASNSVEKCTF